MKLIGLFMALALAVIAAEVSTNQPFKLYAMPERKTNQIQLRIVNRTAEPPDTNWPLKAYKPMDYTATNVLVECSHEPVLMGKSNGVWLLHFR